MTSSTNKASTQPLPGLPEGEFSDWLARVCPQLDGPVRSTQITGGRSNLTYRVDVGPRALVVRRPPLGHVLPTAHDMVREYTVLTALAGTDVPVPRPVALCHDDSVIGAPFYVMEFVPGVILRSAADLTRLGKTRTQTISTALVDTLVALQAIDPGAVGLADFGRPEGFLERQLRRWRAQLEESNCRRLPAAEVLHDMLMRRLPRDPVIRSGIVHGDYRLDNVLIDEHDDIQAVIDWEMATLGDPITDLAMLLVYGRLAHLPCGEPIADAPAAAGYLDEDQVIRRYEHGASLGLANLGFHVGLQAYKLAAIFEGLHFRHIHGQTVGPGFEHVQDATEPVLELGLNAMKELA